MNRSNRRYMLRGTPSLVLGCVLGVIAGAVIGGVVYEEVFDVLHGKPPFFDDLNYPGGGLGGAIYARVFWNLFLTPCLLPGALLVGLPTLKAIEKWRPGWLGPKLIYALGFAGGGGAVWLTVSLISFAVTGLVNLSIGPFVLGAALGLPAAAVLRLVALRKT